jgi:hypothetical protein
MMITGDAQDTAIVIAKDVNICNQDASSKDLKRLKGRELFLNWCVCPTLHVARDWSLQISKLEPMWHRLESRRRGRPVFGAIP